MLISCHSFSGSALKTQGFLRKTPLSDADTKSKKSHISTIIRIFIAFGAVALIVVLGDFNAANLKSAFGQLNLWSLAAAIGLFFVANLVIGCRWYLLLRAQHIDVKLAPCIKIHFLGLFYNNILISSVGGDLLRAWYITKHTHKRLEAALSVLVDRVIGLFTLVLMAVSFYVLFPVEGDAGKLDFSFDLDIAGKLSQYRWVIAGLAAVGVAGVAAVFIHPAGRKKLHLIYAAVLTAMERVFVAIRLYCTKPFTILSAIGLTFVAQSLPILGYCLIGRLMGLDVPFKYYFVFFPISWVLGALPISPAGAGVLEGGVVFLFTRVPGVTMEQALVLALCQRVMFLVCSIPGVIIHISGAHLPVDEEGIEGEA